MPIYNPHSCSFQLFNEKLTMDLIGSVFGETRKRALTLCAFLIITISNLSHTTVKNITAFYPIEAREKTLKLALLNPHKNTKEVDIRCCGVYQFRKSQARKNCSGKAVGELLRSVLAVVGEGFSRLNIHHNPRPLVHFLPFAQVSEGSKSWTGCRGRCYYQRDWAIFLLRLHVHHHCFIGQRQHLTSSSYRLCLHRSVALLV